MKVFRELELQGAKFALTKAIEVISESLDKGWSREIDKERWISDVTSSQMYCFSCRKEQEREAAELWLGYRNDETLEVKNIIAQETGRLSVDRYNFIIDEFYECFVEPVVDALRLRICLSPTTKPIEELLSEEIVSNLKRFARLAHKNSSIFYLLDEQRWRELLIAIRTEASDSYLDILARWLIESDGWLEEANAIFLTDDIDCKETTNGQWAQHELGL